MFSVQEVTSGVIKVGQLSEGTQNGWGVTGVPSVTGLSHLSFPTKSLGHQSAETQLGWSHGKYGARFVEMDELGITTTGLRKASVNATLWQHPSSTVD